MTDDIVSEDTIKVDSSFLKKRVGRKTTEERRRLSKPVEGKVQGKRNHFTEKEKLKAVCTYAVAGNSRRVAEITGIPEGTIRSWKGTEWWAEAMSRIIVEQDDELGTKLTNLVNKAVDEVNDRLDNGNYVYNPKLDKLIRKPVDAKELAIVTAISIDKRQLLRGLPTSRTETVSQTERLKGLSEQFKKFVTAKDITQDAIEIGEEQENNSQEHNDRNGSWETEETGSGNSDVESWEEEDENALTINEMFSE